MSYNKCAFDVGDSVTVKSHGGEFVAVRKVVTVSKNGKTFEDSKGIEWCNEISGRLNGSLKERWYMDQRVYATRPGDADKVRRMMIISRVGATPWAELSSGTLSAIDALVKADPKTGGAA